MDLGRVLTMLFRMFLRRGLGRLMRGAVPRTGAGRAQSREARDLARRARQAARITRPR
jgi:hypothetical protein